MAVKNNRRTLITKRILKESLLELMADKSISQITIKEICELSDMSRSTFYLHYHDQYELLEDIEKDVLDQTFDNLKSLDTEINSIESITVFLNYVRQNKSTFGILLCRNENQPFQEAIIEKVQKYIQSIVPSQNTSEKDQMLYSFIMHGSLNIIIDWIHSDFKMNEKDLAKIIYYACDNVMTH